MRNGIGRGLLAPGTAGAVRAVLPPAPSTRPAGSPSVPWSRGVPPEGFRGRRYRTFIAPSYFERLMPGQAGP